MVEEYQAQSISSEIRQSLKISLPLIATYLIQASSGFVGTIMLARLGSQALAAGALVSGLYITLIVFLFGVLSAVSVLVAQNFGAKNKEGIQLAVSQGMILSIIISLPMMVAVWYAPYALKWMGQNAQVIAFCVPYLHALSWCLIPLGLLVAMEQYFIGIAKTRLVLWVSLLEVPLEIFACYVLVFGKWGFPKLGIAGLGYGFAIVFVFVTFYMAWLIHTSYASRDYHIFSHFKWFDSRYILELLRVGSPVGLMYIIEVACYLGLAIMMGWVGDVALAAHQIALQYANLTIMIVFGISQTTTVTVGHAVGRDDRVEVKRSTYVNLILGTIILFIVALIYIFLSKQIIALDVNIHDPQNAPLIHDACVFLAIVAVAQLGDTWRNVAFGALRGLKDTRIPMYISILTFWCIGIPISYLFAFKFHWAGAGLWWGIVIGIIIGAWMLLARFKNLADKVDLKGLLM